MRHSTNHYHKGKAQPIETKDPEQLKADIEAFLGSCRSPGAIEYGDPALALRPGEYCLEIRSGQLWLEAWSDERSFARRISSLDRIAPGSLECTILRFGGKAGSLSFLDLERPQTASRQLTAKRLNFGEQFRRMLLRQFPGWELRILSAGMDLQRSLSPVFPRAALVRGRNAVAAIACPSTQDESTFLTFALLWFDHLRASLGGVPCSLCLFLPQGVGCLTAHRLRWLNNATLRSRLFLFNEHGSAGEVDGADLGNLATEVSPHYQVPVLPPELNRVVEALAADPLIGFCPERNGSMTVRFRGLAFASLENSRVRLGLTGRMQDVDPQNAFGTLSHFAAELRRLSDSCSIHGSQSENLWAGTSENWLEGAVRKSITMIDPLLRPVPLHRQVITFAGADRDAVDLLGIGLDGRLVVLELKTKEDIHLPLQALDYWMRVSWHAQGGELQPFFPGLPLQAEPPRLLLVAPALSFHSTNEVILRYFSAKINVERVGINSEWSRDLQVVTRLRNADLPQSHQEAHE